LRDYNELLSVIFNEIGRQQANGPFDANLWPHAEAFDGFDGVKFGKEGRSPLMREPR
jgi:hypothetical protein